MKFAQSLSVRLVFYWILGSFVAYFTLPVTVFLPLSAFAYRRQLQFQPRELDDEDGRRKF